MKVVVTGAAGLVGWHAASRLHAQNCAARFAGRPVPFDMVAVDRSEFGDPAKLRNAVENADAVLHFAGLNRGPDDEIEAGNARITDALIDACRSAGARPHIVFANSTQRVLDNAYGRAKRYAEARLSELPGDFTNLVLPNIFGEGALPFYNTVTATFIHQISNGAAPAINEAGAIDLIHAGDAAQAAIDATTSHIPGERSLEGRRVRIPDLYEMLRGLDATYKTNEVPDLKDDFVAKLFNCYRFANFPSTWPRVLEVRADARGVLVEVVKSAGAGQTSFSSTVPGAVRGNHFHLDKMERFLVAEGEAVVKLRRVLDTQVHSFSVSGAQPAIIDIPTLYTHSIANVGTGPLHMLFWTHPIFDPLEPDTYADEV